MSHPKRILLVDDDPDIRKMIAAFLSSTNCEIVEASDISVALEEVSNSAPFDLAILDFWLGKNHAISIMDAITAQSSDVPIIMISGGNSVMDLEKTAAISDVSGALKFLQKPFGKADLLDAVTSALQ